MKIQIIALAIVASFAVAPAFAQAPTNEQIEQILAQPPTEALAVCFGTQRGMQFEVCAQGPLQRIALAARDAKKSYKPFTLADVTDAMRADVWMVMAQPSKPVLNQGRWAVTPAATDALFMPRGSHDGPVVRPKSFTLMPQSWGNALGAKFEGAGFSATFNPADLPPAGSLDLVILTSDKEQRYQLNEENRLRVK